MEILEQKQAIVTGNLNENSKCMRQLVGLLRLQINSAVKNSTEDAITINETGTDVECLLKSTQFRSLVKGNTNLNTLIEKYSLSDEDIAFIVFAYAWEYQHETFNDFIVEKDNLKLRSHFQGAINNSSLRFVPFLHTFLNLYFLENKEYQYNYFTSDKHPLIKNKIIRFVPWQEKQTVLGKMNCVVKLDESYANYFMGSRRPQFDDEIGFPAKLVSSEIPYKDIVLTEGTEKSLEPFKRWLRIRDKMKNENPLLLKKVRKNQLFVFSGAPGTGKTLTATTIGQKYGLSTYTLDLTRVVSKYIGEFEKAMERVFQKLDGEEAILFIDEADAIISKRSEEITDSKDKYANQEMSYLLQRVEKFDGIVILATNVRDVRTYFDKAMLRRISDIIEFGFPLQKERYTLWSKAISAPFEYKEGVVEKLAEQFQVTGANISSTISNVIIECLDTSNYLIDLELVEKHLQKEFFKRDSTFGICRDNAPAALLMEQRLGRLAAHTGKRM